MIPPWYGVAWEDWMRREVVCLPYGVNVVAQLVRAVYFSIKHGGRHMRSNVRAAYDDGYKQALKDVRKLENGGVREY